MAKATPDAIVSAFGRLAARAPGAPLLVSPGRASVTVHDLDTLARGVEGRVDGLASMGEPIGLAAPNGAGFLAAFLALRRRGAIVLLLDAQSPPAELRRVATALGAKALVTCREEWPRRPSSFSCEGLTPTVATPYPSRTAVVKLTSGSTGQPRGVAVTADALAADDDALAASMGLRADERVVAAIPMAHSYGFSSVALPALVRGSLLIVPGPHGPLSALAAAHEAGASFFPTVPAYLQALLKMARPPIWPATLRKVVSAGAPLSPDTALRFRKTYGLPVHAFYGASECGGICYDREGGAGERGTVGEAVDGVRVTLQASGDPGEGVVSVASPALALAYHSGGETTPMGAQFQTNDVASWAGTELHILRRLDSMINIRGRKVDPSEIERVISTLPGVEDVVALGVPSPGADDVLRVVIACPVQRVAYADVLVHCRSRLPDHKVPRSIIVVSEIPRTSRGKVDRTALLAPDSEKRLNG